MNKDIIIDRLERIFCKVFEDATIQISEDLTAAEVGSWNSLTHIYMISEVEKAFGIKFKLKELNKLRNVGDLITIISDKLAAQ
jgi:acyl carrier protein